MSIVITGSNGFRNRGVEALIAPSVCELRSRLPDQEVVVFSRQPQFDLLREHVDARIILDPFIGRVNSLRFRRLGARFAARFFRAESRAIQEISNSSLVIASGGDNFSSDYGDIRMHLEPLSIAQSRRIPTVMLAQSIGPFETKLQRKHFLAVAEHVDLITVRESRSYEYVIHELGIDPQRVYLTADPAFLLEPANPNTIKSLQGRYGLSSDRPVVSLAMSQGITSFPGLSTTAQNVAEVHLDTLCKVTQYAIDQLDSQVLLVPHVQEVSPNNNDLYLAEQIVDQLRDPRVHVAWGNHSASEYKGLIAASELVIAERMHAALAGLSTATPTVAVRYSVKADGIMGDLLGDEAATLGGIIPFEHFIAEGGLHAVDTIHKAWANRKQLREMLNSRLDQVRSLSASNYDMIADLLTTRAQR